MATEKISFVEYQFKDTFAGKQMIVEGETKTIVDLQFEPKTRQILLEYSDGSKYTVHKDQIVEFVVDTERDRIKPNKRIK